MNFVNTIIVSGQAYTVQDPNALPKEEFAAALGDVEMALDALHTYAESLGGEGA